MKRSFLLALHLCSSSCKCSSWSRRANKGAMLFFTASSLQSISLCNCALAQLWQHFLVCFRLSFSLMVMTRSCKRGLVRGTSFTGKKDDNQNVPQTAAAVWSHVVLTQWRLRTAVCAVLTFLTACVYTHPDNENAIFEIVDVQYFLIPFGQTKAVVTTLKIRPLKRLK